jgi:hypothetical protein
MGDSSGVRGESERLSRSSSIGSAGAPRLPRSAMGRHERRRAAPPSQRDGQA